MGYDLKEVCKDIRCDIMTCIGHLGVGHIGGCLSIVEALAVLYFEEMNIDPADPKKEGRDRFVCSKGHAGPAVYATLANRGFFGKEELLTLNQGGPHLPSRCDMNLTTGIDMSTGSLGQGFSCAMGIALGSKLSGDGATIYAMVGDGESQEGQIWEAALFGAAKKLDNVIAFTDSNKLQIDGAVEDVNGLAPLKAKWEAFGWNAIEVENGNDVDQVSAAVKQAKGLLGQGKPTMIILNTKKGCGVKWIEDLGASNHNTNINEEQAKAAIEEIRGN